MRYTSFEINYRIPCISIIGINYLYKHWHFLQTKQIKYNTNIHTNIWKTNCKKGINNKNNQNNNNNNNNNKNNNNKNNNNNNNNDKNNQNCAKNPKTKKYKTYFINLHHHQMDKDSHLFHLYQ